MRRFLFPALFVMALVCPRVFAQEVDPALIEKRIAEGVDRILATQRADGTFLLESGPLAQFLMGQTGLSVMALQYALPHLQEQQKARVTEAVKKGLDCLAQTECEPRTYSLAIVICALYRDDPVKHQKILGKYAKFLAECQHPGGPNQGLWGYPGSASSPDRKSAFADNSNSQFAILGLYFADRAGFQVPRLVWQRAGARYMAIQYPDGGWGYSLQQDQDKPYANMTIASSVSLYLCDEMLAANEKGRCQPRPQSKSFDAGMQWLKKEWDEKGFLLDPYGLYALERLGILTGRSNIGGHDWYNEGARQLIGGPGLPPLKWKSPAYVCFEVMFLARGREPILVNKLERRDTDDWNNTPYDVKHLVDHLEDAYQKQGQFRIVTLEAKLEQLLRTPILHVSGHKALDFNDAEKKKLKDYVDRGGTIFAQACCGQKAFDKSFRALVKEVFGGELTEVDEGHRVFQRMSAEAKKKPPKIEVFALSKQQNRPGIIYLSDGVARAWHLGGSRAKDALNVGAAIALYVIEDVPKAYPDAPKIDMKPPEPVAPPPAGPEPKKEPKPGFGLELN